MVERGDADDGCQAVRAEPELVAGGEDRSTGSRLPSAVSFALHAP